MQFSNCVSKYKMIAYLCIALLFSGFCHANSNKQIQVTGFGSVQSAPDYLSFSIFLEEKGETAVKLSAQLRQKTQLITDMLLDKDVDKKHISMLPLQLQPWFEGRGQERQQKGFILTQQLNIKITQFDNYAAILDNVLRIGAARISAGQYGVDDSEGLYQKALAMALDNAKSKAAQMAKNVGVELAEVISLQEQGGVSNRPMMLESRMRTSSNELLPGTLDIQARVDVVYAIK